nr:hypothetical protein [uncultured Arsenicibacter sp.]
MTAVQNPLKIVKTDRVSQRMANDMPRRNSLLLKHEVITEMSRFVNPANPFFIFGGGFLGGGESVEPNLIDPDMRGIASEFYRIRKYQEVCTPARVLDNRNVPDTLVAGKNFDITLDKFVGDPGTKLLLRDQTTMLMVVSQRGSSDKRYDYTLQLNNQEGKTASGSLLAIDSILQYETGNSVGEGSFTGSTFVDEGEQHVDTMNVMQITRHLLTETGSAMADELFKFTVEITEENGLVRTEDVVVDIPIKSAKKHFAAINRDLLFGVPNFSFNKVIANRINNSRYPERPTYAGYYWWMDRCPWQWPAFQSDPLDSGVKLIERIIDHQSEIQGRKVNLVAMATGIGRQWIKKVLQRAMELKKYQIQIVDPKDRLKIGFEVDEYYTMNGTLRVIDMFQGQHQWSEYFDKATYNGISYAQRSRHIYIQPMTIPGMNGNQKPARLYFKRGNGIDRAFVLGTSNGMYGQNGLTLEKMNAMSEAGVKRLLESGNSRIDSTFDGREIHMLSHLSPYINCDYMSRITLYP